MTKFINDIPDEKILGAVCDLKYGKSLPAPKRTPGEYPVFGSNGQVGSHTESLTQGPTIIIGRKGSFGEVHFSEKSCWPIDTTYYIDERSTKENLKWLSYYLQTLGLTKLNRAAAIPGLNREDAYRINIRIPSLAEQDRVAALLESMDDLREKRRRSIELLDELTQSIFLEMFGEPGDDWTSLTVQEISEPTKGSIRTGPFGSQLLHDEFVDEGIRVLGIDNAVDNEFKWGKPRFITEEKYQQLSRYTVRPGDLLITIMGTCGRCAVVPEDIPTAINTKHLCCITLDRQKCLPEFLHSYFLMHPKAQSYLHQKAKGAIMSGLNMGIIKRLPIFLPPLELQQQYVDKVERVREQKKQHQTHLAHLDELFASVQQRAFNGTLWNDPAVAS